MLEEDDKYQRGTGNKERESDLVTPEVTTSHPEEQERRHEEQEVKQEGGITGEKEGGITGEKTEQGEGEGKEEEGRGTDEGPVVDSLSGEEGAVVETYSEQQEGEIIPVHVTDCKPGNLDGNTEEELGQDGSVAEQMVEEEGSPIDCQCTESNTTKSLVNWAVETDHQYSKPLEKDDTVAQPHEENKNSVDEDVVEEVDSERVNDPPSQSTEDVMDEKGETVMDQKVDMLVDEQQQADIKSKEPEIEDGIKSIEVEEEKSVTMAPPEVSTEIEEEGSATMAPPEVSTEIEEEGSATMAPPEVSTEIEEEKSVTMAPPEVSTEVEEEGSATVVPLEVCTEVEEEGSATMVPPEVCTEIEEEGNAAMVPPEVCTELEEEGSAPEICADVSRGESKKLTSRDNGTSALGIMENGISEGDIYVENEGNDGEGDIYVENEGNVGEGDIYVENEEGNGGGDISVENEEGNDGEGDNSVVNEGNDGEGDNSVVNEGNDWEGDISVENERNGGEGDISVEDKGNDGEGEISVEVKGGHDGEGEISFEDKEGHDGEGDISVEDKEGHDGEGDIFVEDKEGHDGEGDISVEDKGNDVEGDISVDNKEGSDGEGEVVEEETMDSDGKSDFLVIDSDAAKDEEILDEQQNEGEEDCESEEKEYDAALDTIVDQEINEPLESENLLSLEEPMEMEDAGELEAGNEEEEDSEVNASGNTEMAMEDLNDEEITEDVNSSYSNSTSLPQCRLKRNYCCIHCGINTQNPREYLYHLRDDHGEKMKVFECPRCIYASKNHQKLIRHARMVHKLKIKRLEASTSPYKGQSKSPVLRVSPVKVTRASATPTKSTRSSPGKSPRRTESPTDTWEEMDDEDSQLEPDDSPMKGDDKRVLYCEHCEYSCRSRKLLNRHETSYHLKRRFFRCLKCNYVTHLKGRYTKHMKYHQLPILKCDYCDFRTPYRWNLDRHLKNHTEECGEYRCHMCNFTAQIKQSLTVHISNHHLTAEQIREKEMRRTIGISDPADCTSDDQELEMLRLERDEHPDALLLPGFSAPGSPTNPDASNGQQNGSSSFRVSNIDVGNQDDSQMNAEENEDEDGEPRKKKPKIKITLTKMKAPKTKDTFFQELNERHNFEEDFIHPDDVVHRHGNVYIKTFKCRFCNFKAAFKNEVSRHEKKIHSIPLPKPEGPPRKARKTLKSKLSRRSRITSSDDVLSQILQFPQIECTNTQSDSKVLDAEDHQSGKTDDKVEAKDENSHGDYTLLDDDSSTGRDASPEPREDQSSASKESSPSKESNRKKNLSFFEKLQEKMPTSNVQNLVCQFCGHESKCLSESVRHQKLHLSAKNIYASASLSTRCQFCRHRCKTTDDLVHHLKLCPEARKNQITDSGRRLSGNSRVDDNEDSLSSGKGENLDEDENEVADIKDEGAMDEASLASLDEAHPMENRVFVWNKFDKSQEEQNLQDKKDNVQDDKEKVGKWSRRNSTESVKKSSGRSDSKSPVSFDMTLDYIESPTPQGHHYYSKRVYRCPQCSFWATTASRFHVHIVGHFNRKPYNCSECGYKSNWRWDITKHIKLKTSRDSSHANAQVIITDETGEKNYEKYDCYLAIIQLDETNAHRTEGGIPTRKGRPKRTPEKEEILPEATPSTPSASPLRKPPMVAIPMMPRMQNLPRLTRAPGRIPASRPGPMPFGPILPGPQMMVQLAGSGSAAVVAAAAATTAAAAATTASTTTAAAAATAAKAVVAAAAAAAAGNTNARPPPPLTLRGAPKAAATAISNKTSGRDSPATTPGQYEIITSQRPCENLLVLKSLVLKRCSDRMVLQGSVNTSLETLQLLASGSTNLSKLKKQPKGSFADSGGKDNQAALSHQVSVSSTGEDGKEVAKMVLDHEGNPEWKCNACDFRDSERETVIHHVRLAHTRNGPVSLLHAVHRCDLCGYAAGTKRAVQLHIDSSHGGQGGITSRCEGQNPEHKESAAPANENEGSGENSDSGRSFQCRLCPFTCTKRSRMRPHLLYHVARPDCIFKCMFCPYYVPTKQELFEHLSLHDDCPWAVLEQANLNRSNSNSPGPSTQQEENGPRQFVCGSCPYESRSRSKLMHHRQFHKPKGLPFRCPHCSYNVTRRHLLSQHIRVHGLVDNTNGNVANEVGAQVDERSNSPSPSLTITPVANATTSNNSGEDPALTDSSQLPKLTDESTIHMDDIPLVWVSRDRRFFKMFKCRHCPHVNLRKTNIQEHEKMHKTNISKEAGGLHCPYCSYVSVNAGVMSAHLKVHGGSMGQCHAVVEPSLSDEDQLKQLTSRACTPSPDVSQPLTVADDTSNRKADEKVLYYCQCCPARFFLEKEIQIHTRFHNTSLPLTCDHCDYGARQSAHLLTHLKVHTPEYQQRTRTMMGQHRTASNYPPVPGLTIPVDLREKSALNNDGDSSQRMFSGSPTPASNLLPQPPPTSKYMCDECPASFSKQLTLQYHQSLHGAKNAHPCSRCSYAGKTQESLQQHTQLHTQHDQNCLAEKIAKEASKKAETQKALEASMKTKIYTKSSEKDSNSYHPPIKLKLIGLRPGTSDSVDVGSRPQFKYYIEEQVPLSGVDLLRRKTQLEKEGSGKMPSDAGSSTKTSSKTKHSKEREDVEENDPKRVGDPKLHYPLHIDKVTGRSREKRYKCKKCPSAFEKVEQYNVHTNLHGSSHKYRCRICDYSVKFYANFMMHINRHKYHERMVSQTEGTAVPVDSDPKYEPIISRENSHGDKAKNHVEDSGNKENLDEADLTTTERQHLLLQNKKGVTDSSKKDDEKERRVYYCQYCPYANIRRDAVDSHSLRHHANGGYGSYRCTFCDYTASQPNFIREHTKVHFRPFKYVNPEGFMRHDRQEVISTPIILGGRIGGGSKIDGASRPTQEQEKYIVFTHDMGASKPTLTSDGEEESADVDPTKHIQVNFRSGDIVDAPNDFVISLRSTKSKGHHSQVELVDTVPCEATDAAEKYDVNSSVGVSTQICEDQMPDQMKNQPVQENVQDIGDNEDKINDDSKEGDKTSMPVSNPCNSDDNKMEVDISEREKPVDVCMTNGLNENEPQGSAVSEEAMEIDAESKVVTGNDDATMQDLPPVANTCEKDQPKHILDSH